MIETTRANIHIKAVRWGNVPADPRIEAACQHCRCISILKLHINLSDLPQIKDHMNYMPDELVVTTKGGNEIIYQMWGGGEKDQVHFWTYKLQGKRTRTFINVMDQ